MGKAQPRLPKRSWQMDERKGEAMNGDLGTLLHSPQCLFNVELFNEDENPYT